MNKRLTILMVMLILIGLVGTVSAEMPSSDVVRIEKGTTYDFVSGCSKNTRCNEYPGFKTYFKIYKGWNLVPIGERVVSPISFCNNPGTPILKYKFVYFPGRGYIGGKINWNNDNFVNSNTQQKFENQVGTMREEDLLSFMLSSYWIYSEKDCEEYPAATNLYRDIDRAKSADVIDKIRLKRGWNLFHLHPLFLNEKLKDIIGTCNIKKANVWNPIGQKWDFTNEESSSRVNDLLNTQIVEELLYTPLLIKVADNCKLGSGLDGDSEVTPPQMPDDGLGCIDSDGGENYQTKGRVTTKDASGKKLVGDDSCQLSTWKSNGGYNNQGYWDYTDVYSCFANTNNDAANNKMDRCLVNEKFCGEGPTIPATSKYCPNGCKNGVCEIVEDLK